MPCDALRGAGIDPSFLCSNAATVYRASFPDSERQLKLKYTFRCCFDCGMKNEGLRKEWKVHSVIIDGVIHSRCGLCDTTHRSEDMTALSASMQRLKTPGLVCDPCLNADNTKKDECRFNAVWLPVSQSIALLPMQAIRISAYTLRILSCGERVVLRLWITKSVGCFTMRMTGTCALNVRTGNPRSSGIARLSRRRSLTRRRSSSRCLKRTLTVARRLDSDGSERAQFGTIESNDTSSTRATSDGSLERRWLGDGHSGRRKAIG